MFIAAKNPFLRVDSFRVLIYTSKLDFQVGAKAFR